MPRSLLWPDPRVKPPFGAAEIDWGHPLASGLAGLWIVNEGGGASLADMTGQTPLGFSGTQTWLAGAEGLALVPDNSGTGPRSAGTSALGLTGPMTLAARWRSTSNQNNVGLVGKYGFYTGQQSYGLIPTGNTQNRMLIRVAGADKVASGTIRIGIDVDVVTVCFGRFDGANVLADIYSPLGALLESITGDATTGPIDTSTARFTVGNLDDGNRALSGRLREAAVWRVALPNVLLQWFAAEPYAMLRPIVRRRYFVFHKVGPLIHAANPQLITAGGSLGGATL